VTPAARVAKRERERERVARKRASGVCLRCPDAVSSPRVHCLDCLEIERGRGRRRYAALGGEAHAR
jgi:hypothetical protein